jgi:hypothetical protein
MRSEMLRFTKPKNFKRRDQTRQRHEDGRIIRTMFFKGIDYEGVKWLA